MEDMDCKTTQKENKSRALSSKQFFVCLSAPISVPWLLPPEFSSRNNVPLTGRRLFPYPLQQQAGCLLSLHHNFHSTISTYLLFRETCRKCKTRSAETTALIFLSEPTTLVNLRESIQSEGLHNFMKTYPITSDTLQTMLAVQESTRFTLPFEERPSEREHSPSRSCGMWYNTAPPAISAFKTSQEHLACPCF